MMDETRTAAAPKRLTFHEAMGVAQQCHRDGLFDQAESVYRALRKLEPGNADAMHFFGVLRHQQGHTDEALALVRESIAIDPAVASWHNNLGNVLLENQQLDAAAAAYTQCAELDPGNCEVLNNLGVMLAKQNRLKASEAAFREALVRNPGFADAHTNLGSLYGVKGRSDDALHHLFEAIRLDPEDLRPRRSLGRVYLKLGDREKAAELFRDWALRDPESVEARHFLAAVTGENVPDRAPDMYVTELFDTFAASFDAKLAFLEYRAPQWVGEAAALLLGEPRRRHHILDIGCGTGLCASYLAPYAKRLVGVDLSRNMLTKAEARGLYDELVRSELVAYLRACKEPQDMIVSADVLIYFGRLDAAFAAARQALRAGGHLLFTVESHTDADDFKLQGSGRYSHARAYVERELDRAGLRLCEVREVVLRLESQVPVAGFLVTADVIDSVT